MTRPFRCRAEGISWEFFMESVHDTSEVDYYLAHVQMAAAGMVRL